jgi:hypothetical protein
MSDLADKAATRSIGVSKWLLTHTKQSTDSIILVW